jgi:hypothetical protein
MFPYLCNRFAPLQLLALPPHWQRWRSFIPTYSNRRTRFQFRTRIHICLRTFRKSSIMYVPRLPELLDGARNASRCMSSTPGNIVFARDEKVAQGAVKLTKQCGRGPTNLEARWRLVWKVPNKVTDQGEPSPPGNTSTDPREQVYLNTAPEISTRRILQPQYLFKYLSGLDLVRARTNSNSTHLAATESLSCLFLGEAQLHAFGLASLSRLGWVQRPNIWMYIWPGNHCRSDSAVKKSASTSMTYTWPFNEELSWALSISHASWVFKCRPLLSRPRNNKQKQC